MTGPNYRETHLDRLYGTKASAGDSLTPVSSSNGGKGGTRTVRARIAPWQFLRSVPGRTRISHSPLGGWPINVNWSRQCFIRTNYFFFPAFLGSGLQFSVGQVTSQVAPLAHSVSH
jgi:hypothetical protein